MKFVFAGILAFMSVFGSIDADALDGGIPLKIRNARSLACLEIVRGSSEWGAVLQTWECSDSRPEQKFRIESEGSRIEIRNDNNDMCLEVPYGYRESGSRIAQSQCQKFSHMFWKLEEIPGDEYIIRAGHAEHMCMALVNLAGTRHGSIAIKPCDRNDPSQQFYIRQ